MYPMEGCKNNKKIKIVIIKLQYIKDSFQQDCFQPSSNFFTMSGFYTYLINISFLLFSLFNPSLDNETVVFESSSIYIHLLHKQEQTA